MAPNSRSAHSMMHPDAGLSEVEATAESPNAPVVPLGSVMGLSPPGYGLTSILILRV